MTAGGLAWRTLTAERSRALLAVAGVAVIGALLFDMLMLSRGLLVSLRQMLDNAGYDVRVVGSDNLPIASAISHASLVAREVADLPEVREVMVVRTDRARALVSGRPAVEVALVNVTEGAESRAWRIIAGSDLPSARKDTAASSGSSASYGPPEGGPHVRPQGGPHVRPQGGPPAQPQGGPYVQRSTASPPAVIDRRLAAVLALAPGAPLRLRVIMGGEVSVLPVATFEVVGTADFLETEGSEYIVATTSEAFDKARGSIDSDTADVILVASRSGVESAATVAAIARKRSEVRAFSNDQVVARFDEAGFAYFRQISFVLSTITLCFAFLLVATLLTVSVNQRLGQVAALRALGLPRRRIAAMLAWESACLVGVGGALSLPAGWALAMQLDRILRQMPNIPDRMHFFVFEPAVALWHVALLAGTGVAAAIYPVWIATRLPIASTLRLETIS